MLAQFMKPGQQSRNKITGTRMSEITYRAAWRKNDPELERDALTFWDSKKKLLPQNADANKRVKQLCAVAYRDEKPVGVSTVSIEFVPQLRLRMAVYRCSVAIGMRRKPLSWTITDFSREVLEEWSLAHPEEKCMGLLAVLQAREFVERYPMVTGPANMTFIGVTPQGFPVRVSWFKHAEVPNTWPPKPLPRQAAGPAQRQMQNRGPGITLPPGRRMQ